MKSIATRNKPNSGPRMAFGGLDHAGTLFKKDAPHIALTLQHLGRERGAHLGSQIRLSVPPYGVSPDPEPLRDGPLRQPRGDGKIDLRPCRVVADLCTAAL
jgi:hypothetical protein